MNARNKAAKIIFDAQGHVNMFTGEPLEFHEAFSTLEKERAFRAADALITANLIQEPDGE